MSGEGTRPLSRVAVLLSGRGSNFLALHGAMERGEIPAEIRLVVSNNPQAVGIKRAKELGVATSIFPHRGLRRRDHEKKILAALQEAEVDWVCLAGYMRLLSPNFVSVFPRRVLNIHPSLLPAFPGLDAQRQALELGVKITGCTVHLVDEGLDSGPIVVQRSVEVAQEDTEDLLGARILLEEHRAYPEALRRLLTEKWSIVGRRAVFGGKMKITPIYSQKEVDTPGYPPYDPPPDAESL